MVVIKKGSRIFYREAQKLSFLGRFRGLMFRSKNTQNLFFEFTTPKQRAIHSYFVFFPFLALWLDERNRVIDYHVVQPFTSLVKPKEPAKSLLELPFNKKNEQIINFFVDKGKI